MDFENSSELSVISENTLPKTGIRNYSMDGYMLYVQEQSLCHFESQRSNSRTLN